MFSDDELASPIDIERLIKDSVKEIVKHEDAELYLAWIDENFDHYLVDFSIPQPYPLEIPPHMAAVLGRSIWNSTPLPNNHLKPKRLPEPNHNAPCICGSGAKYKQCCVGIPELSDFDEDIMLSIVASLLPEKRLKILLDDCAFNHQGLLTLAENYMENEKLRKAAILLERVFEAPISKKGELEEYILTTLCNLYDELGYNNKKMTLLNRLISQVGKSVLRAGAWQRMAVIHADIGDMESAWKLFQLAQRDDPNSIFLGILEVQLLLNENKTEKAAERANFYVKRMERQGLHDEPMLDFLRQIAQDPLQAMMEAGSGDPENEDLLRLSQWVKTAQSIPTLSYKCELFEFSSSEESDNSESSITKKPEAELQAPKAIYQVDQKWFQDIGGLDSEGLNGGNPHYTNEWLAFLEKHPASINSLFILDEIITATTRHPQGVTPWMEKLILLPLLQHAEKIILKALDGRDIKLSWLSLDNRPALRLLMGKSYAHQQQGEIQLSIETLKRILLLNPDDNQGARAVLINEYLVTGNDSAAINLANNYPEDAHAEIIYGKVLALYKLQNYIEAKSALQIAVEQLPKVVTYLTRKRIKQPPLDGNGFMLGGDDQAWLYRESSRELWLAEPGALEWLKKTTKGCRKD